MGLDFTYFIPCIVCLVCLYLLRTEDDKEISSKKGLLLAFYSVLTAINAILSTNSADRAYISVLFIIEQSIAILLIPSTWIFMGADRNGRFIQDSSLKIWIPVSFLLAAMQLMSVFITGGSSYLGYINQLSDCRLATLTNSADPGLMYLFCTTLLLDLLLIIQFAGTIIIVVIGNKRKKETVSFPDNRRINIAAFLCTGLYLLLIFLRRIPMTGSAYVFGAILSVLLSISLLEFSKLMFHNSSSLQTAVTQKEIYGQERINSVFEIDKAEAVIKSKDVSKPDITESDITPSVPEDDHEYDEDSLRSRFESLMETEQLFLRQGLKVTDVASMLETNRTYISRLVNNTFHMSFPEYINTLRVDYAEQYIVNHSEASQVEIAKSCGFPNASSFNSIFRKITGVTPRTWYKNHNANINKSKSQSNE